MAHAKRREPSIKAQHTATAVKTQSSASARRLAMCQPSNRETRLNTELLTRTFSLSTLASGNHRTKSFVIWTSHSGTVPIPPNRGCGYRFFSGVHTTAHRGTANKIEEDDLNKRLASLARGDFIGARLGTCSAKQPGIGSDMRTQNMMAAGPDQPSRRTESRCDEACSLQHSALNQLLSDGRERCRGSVRPPGPDGLTPRSSH